MEIKKEFIFLFLKLLLLLLFMLFKPVSVVFLYKTALSKVILDIDIADVLIGGIFNNKTLNNIKKWYCKLFNI